MPGIINPNIPIDINIAIKYPQYFENKKSSNQMEKKLYRAIVAISNKILNRVKFLEVSVIIIVLYYVIISKNITTLI